MEKQRSDAEDKRKFALELLKRPDAPFEAACLVFGDDTGKALEASTRWPHDPEVMAHMALAVEEVGEMQFLPTKADLARRAWYIANNEKVPVEDQLKALRLYGDIRGFIERQGGVVVNNNNSLISNKVMLVTDHGSTDQWEGSLIEQQTRLITDANASLAARS